MDALDRQARIAGWLYLLLVIPGPFVLIYLPSKLIVRGDAAATTANLLAHETLFRFGMVADVAGSVFFVVLAFALYRLLSRVDPTRAASRPLFVVSFNDLRLNPLPRVPGILDPSRWNVCPKFGESAHSRTRIGHKELGFTWHCVRLMISKVEFAYHEIKITPRVKL